MFLLDLFLLAFKNLLRRKLRSWLTILGIVIGISSVVSLTSISIGMQKAIEDLLSKMGKDKLMIFPGQRSILFSTLFIGKPFSENTVKKIENLPDVEVAVPFSFTSVKINYNKENSVGILQAIPVSSKIENIGYELLDGRFFKKNDKGKCVAIIGYMIAKKAFSKEIRINDKIHINNIECKVIGILKPTGSRFDDNSIIIPFSTMKERFGIREINMIIVKAKNVENAKKEIERLLKRIRGENFSIMTMGQMLEYAKQMLGLISLIVLAIAGISIVVSGIGIMNTMYMSVTERIKEIGILKAIGAKNYEVGLLFLIESGLIGLVGGIFGNVFGIIFAKTIEYFAKYFGYTVFKSYFDPLIIFGTVLFSFLVGILSGLAPSLSAAKQDPVKALRYE